MLWYTYGDLADSSNLLVWHCKKSITKQSINNVNLHEEFLIKRIAHRHMSALAGVITSSGSSGSSTSLFAAVLFFVSLSLTCSLSTNNHLEMHTAAVSSGRSSSVHRHIWRSMTGLLRTALFSTTTTTDKNDKNASTGLVQRHNVTQLPHDAHLPTWKVGDKQPSPYISNTTPHDPKSFSSFATQDLQAAGGMYNLLISSVVPRPIALLSTQDTAGHHNCAPFSYFNIMCHDPPLVSIGICTNGRQRVKKDSLNNIESSGEFVVNIMSAWFVEAANHCSGNFPPEVDEMQQAGLTALPSDIVKAPRVAESAIQFECKTEYLNEIKNDAGEHTCTIVTGRILKTHIQRGVLTADSLDSNKPVVDWAKLQVVGRLGGNTYTNVLDGFDLLRPSVGNNKK